MSLINQVLNELENRGVRTAAGDEAIRAVPPRRRLRLGFYVLVVAMTPLLVAVAWYLLHARQLAPLPAPPAMAVPAKELVATMAASSVAVLPASAPAAPAAEPATVPDEKPLVAVAADDEPKAMAPPQKQRHHKKKHEAGKAAPTETAVAGDKPQARSPKQKHHKQERAADAAVASQDVQPTADTSDQQLKQITPQQRVENAYARAGQAVQEGRFDDARADYEQVLSLDPAHRAARQALVGVLVRLKHEGEAERVLQDGLKLLPKEVSFAMLLARLQVEQNELPAAQETLQAAAPYAEGRADFQAFMAVLLQRQNHHDEAVSHFRAALKLSPNNGIWLMGLGMSLQALQRNNEARDAYQRALATNSLTPPLQAFVQDKLKEL